jgi:hypothetical protein
VVLILFVVQFFGQQSLLLYLYFLLFQVAAPSLVPQIFGEQGLLLYLFLFKRLDSPLHGFIRLAPHSP